MNALKEAQASLSYYGFKRAPEGDFEDDGTRFFMWVWDPENTGESPFYFSKAGGCGEVFFSEQIRYGSDLYNEIRKRGYHLDDLNGVPKDSFTDEALGKIIAQLQEIRESDWFEAICPEFSTRGAIENGVQIKDYNADKDHQRVMDFAKRAGGDTEKMAKLAANMAKAIGDKEKMRSRWQAAVDIYGSESPVAKAFENQVNERGWYINIKPRSGDIDWSSLFESTIRENVKDESIYNAHAAYEKDQLKKKEEEDNQENFTFDESSVKLATVVKESIEDSIKTDTFVITDFSDDSYKDAKRVKIADGVTTISDNAFEDCESLTSIILPESVTKIGNYAFKSCKSLTSIMIPNSVTEIGNYAFTYCKNLTSIVLPSSVTKIGYSAFSYCSSLKSINIPDGVTKIKEQTFCDCDDLAEIIIPISVTEIGDRAFWDCENLTTINYKGTKDQWNAIKKNPYWRTGCPRKMINCNYQESPFDEGSVKLTTVKESIESFAEEIARRIDETGIFTSRIVDRQNYSEIRVICDRGQIAVFEPENGIIKIFEPSDNDMGVTDGREFLHAYKDEKEYLPSFSKNSIRSLVDYYALKTLYEDDEYEFSYWSRAKNAAWTFEASNLSDVNKYLTVLEDAYEEAKEMSSSIKESTNWNNFFDKLTESTDNDIAALKEYFDTEDVEPSDETCWGLPAYVVNGSETYAVGHSDECYEAAVQSAISVFDDDTEEGKINWLQKWNWPGVDEEGVCEACGDDPDDYEEGETIYQPSSISEYLDTMGFSQASDAFSWDFLRAYVNKHEVGEFVVDYDGVASGLASYDGKEIELPNGLYAYRFR